MSIVKSYSVGAGDMFYIRHNSDNFTIITATSARRTQTKSFKILRPPKQAKVLSGSYAPIQTRTISEALTS